MRDPTPFRIYCQEPTNLPRQDGLRVAVIADGNGRRGAAGYAAGARNVVRCAEHCRDRGDVALLCALLLSPENVEKRGERFFAAMHALFVRLAADVVQGRALSGVRCELHGRLDRLIRRGGAARRLAHAVELLLEAGSAADPAMRLVLGIDYDSELVSALHLDLVVRTGLESSGVVRLSGLRSHPGAACVATMKLWCDFEPRDLDAAITAAERCLPAAFAPGYDAPFVAGFITELLRADLTDPLRIVLPVAAPERALVAALDRLQAGPLGAQERLEVLFAKGRASRPRRFGPRPKASQTLLLLPPAQRRRAALEGSFTALLAPGQPSAVWHLADVPLGYATGHGCAPTPHGLVEGLRKALRFHAANPPLAGAERAGAGAQDEAASAAWPSHIDDLMRAAAERPPSSAEEIARALDGAGAGADAQLIADVFAAQELRWALDRGLLEADAHWKRAALNYCYTGFAIPFRVPEPTNPTGARWEPLARHLTRFMLVVAASDEAFTDRVFPGEAAGDRRARLLASARFLSEVLRGAAPGAAPEVHGAGLLATIAAYFKDLRARFARTSHPLVFEGFCGAAAGLYAANLNEISPAATDNPLLRRLGSARSRARACAAIERRYIATARTPVGARVRALLAAAAADHDASGEARRALRLLCYLTDVAPGIGAGASFRAAALWTPAEAVTDAMAAALDRTATLADYRFRLANDLSDLARSAERDRDAKENAWTILLPGRATGRARERALVRAAVTCDTVAAWLDDDLRAALRELDAVWPSMAAMIRRGIHVGERFYSLGHYAELSRRDVGVILDEAGLPSAAPPPAPHDPARGGADAEAAGAAAPAPP
ncbi:MAG: hypothetical protein IT372_04510, partial [Polyangiaceae bacterium]|nr:hypothetical protein [Polyangiaceae bacterium]